MKTTSPNDSENSVIITKENIQTFEPSLIRAYKSVFNASAWREGKKCANTKCNNKWTFEESPTECCGTSTIDFYSDSEVSASIQSVLSKTYFQCMLLLDTKNEVVGFTWGWQDSLYEINQEKLGLDPNEYARLVDQLKYLGCDPEKRDWYYQSETGIVPEYRKQGVGRQLVMANEKLLQRNSDQIEAIIQRTSKQSSMYKIRKELGYDEVYEYNDADYRVLFAKNNS